MLTARDVDDLLAECIEELPAWVLTRTRATRSSGSSRCRARGRPTPVPHRIIIYRAPLLAHATTRAELRRLTRAELLRLVVERLELEGSQAVELAAVCL